MRPLTFWKSKTNQLRLQHEWKIWIKHGDSERGSFHTSTATCLLRFRLKVTATLNDFPFDYPQQSWGNIWCNGPLCVNEWIGNPNTITDNQGPVSSDAKYSLLLIGLFNSWNPHYLRVIWNRPRSVSVIMNGCTTWIFTWDDGSWQDVTSRNVRLLSEMWASRICIDFVILWGPDSKYLHDVAVDEIQREPGLTEIVHKLISCISRVCSLIYTPHTPLIQMHSLTPA